MLYHVDSFNRNTNNFNLEHETQFGAIVANKRAFLLGVVPIKVTDGRRDVSIIARCCDARRFVIDSASWFGTRTITMSSQSDAGRFAKNFLLMFQQIEA